jgi:hypothetical protein
VTSQRHMDLAHVLALVRPMAVGTIASLVISVAGTELLVRSLMSFQTRGIVWALTAIVTTVACFGLPLTLAASGIARAFRHASREELLVRIIAAYTGMVLCSAGVYYSICVVADFRQEYHAATYYRWHDKRTAHDKIPRYLTEERAFRGIEESIWTGVAHWARSDTTNASDEAPVPALVAAAELPDARLFTALPGARASVFFDCLHLSVITMTTVGYGDISPRTWPAKLATDVQALSSTVLIVVALGMLFGNWWHATPDDLKQPQEQDPKNATPSI